MKKIILAIFSIFLVLTSIVLVFASGFSPSSLTFNLAPGEENCQKITLISDSEKITITDKWAENKNVEWLVSSFNKESTYHKILISYPKEILTEREVEICISGSKSGEYRGVVLLREEQQGNSIVQMGVWLKVNVSGQVEEETSPETEIPEETPAETTQTENSGITGAVISGNENESSGMGISTKIIIYTIIGIILGLIIAGVSYKSYRKKRWENFGY